MSLVARAGVSFAENSCCDGEAMQSPASVAVLSIFFLSLCSAGEYIYIAGIYESVNRGLVVQQRKEEHNKQANLLIRLLLLVLEQVHKIWLKPFTRGEGLTINCR